MPASLIRKQQHSEWEKSVLNAVKTLDDAAKTKENPPSIIKLIGQEIFAALSTQARKDKKAREAHISAALMTVESFLEQQKREMAQLCELGELANQTLARFQIAYDQSYSKKQFEKSLGTKQQAVNERISHLRPQTPLLKPDAGLLFNTKYLTVAQSSTAYKQEIDALRLKANGLYSAHYQTPLLDSLSVVQNGHIHSYVQKGSDEELEKDPECKVAHLQITLTNPIAGEIACVGGEFRRTTKGASRSVPMRFVLKPEIHHDFPLCVQGPAFCWAHPEKLYANPIYWKQIEENKQALILRPERLELNKAFRILKSDLFKEHCHEFSALIEDLVSGIIYRTNPQDQAWKNAIRNFFVNLVQRQDPFTYLATVHQRLQTLVIVRPLQQIDQQHSLTARLAEANSAELESLKGRLDASTHAYLHCINEILLPHTTQALLARPEDQVSDWHKLAQQHAQMQTVDFCQQLSCKQVPSKEELKHQLTQQLGTQIALWTSTAAPAA